MAESPTTALQNKQNREQQYLAVRVGRGPQPLAVEDVYKAESSDYIEDICPYATFQLSKPAYSESSYSGNVYSGPYHSVRGSFLYHDVKPPTIDKFRLGHVSLFSCHRFEFCESFATFMYVAIYLFIFVNTTCGRKVISQFNYKSSYCFQTSILYHSK